MQERTFKSYPFKVEVRDNHNRTILLNKLFSSKGSAQLYIDRFAVRHSFTRKAPFSYYRRNLVSQDKLGYDRDIEYILKENKYLWIMQQQNSNKTDLIRFRVNPADKKLIQDNAKSESLTMSSYILKQIREGNK